ncbi:uncharacterized protein LOC127845858 [Dreissena polymorpha]|uniref:uncharacterized protein LOC127845858 n=1 Tax=Dreissena polymorpha TaxID=45954 RepID=UPI0022648317|nr:uncharacterized protein LOC127845858 [Dreissena polymorpha]
MSFLYDTTETLSQMVNETASTIRNLSFLQETMKTINLQTLSDNLTLETIGVDPEVALKDFNISSSTLDEAIENAKGNVSTDPLLENIASFADEASTFLADEAESANKLFFVNQWIAAMNNVTLEYFDNDTCVSFLDCAHYAIAALYEQFMAVNITNQTESIDRISKFEDTFLLLVGNSSHATEDVDSMAITLLATLRQMKELCVFCSRAPEMLGPLQNLTVNTGQQLSLVCNVTGDPTPTFWWYKDTHIISDQHSMTLTISKANIDDGGSYHCVAGNLVANYSFDEAFVTVLGKEFDDTEGRPSEYTTVNANEETEDSTKGANPSEKSTDLQLEIVLLPVLLGVACACAVVGVLVWRHNKRINARKGGSTASLASLNVVRPMNTKPTFDPKSQCTTAPAVAIK